MVHGDFTEAALEAERRRLHLSETVELSIPGPDPCPCGRAHLGLFQDLACDAARRRERIVRHAAIETSRESDRWL